jgi:hypothetical protein
VTDTVLARVVALSTTPIPDLKKLWRDLFAKEPPPYNRRFLENRLAYRIQELAYGGLKPETVKRLDELAEQLDTGKRAPGPKRGKDDRPVAGTRLLREYQGEVHEVIVHPDYFLYNGQRYASLSAIAKAITHTQWNGWNFFGLRTRGKKS